MHLSTAQLRAEKFVNKFYAYLKKHRKENETVINLYFSKNYSFMVQDEAQCFHWNNDQVRVKYKSFVFIFECLTRNTIAVYVFQRKLILFRKTKILPILQKIYYFSDGSCAQYKHKRNFVNKYVFLCILPSFGHILLYAFST